MKPIDVTLIGGGMISNDLILPSIYQLRRQGTVTNVRVCDLFGRTLQRLRENQEINDAFPGYSFESFPGADADPDELHADLYTQVLDSMEPRNLAVIALPDQTHFTAVMAALERNQHVLCVKPLVLKYEQAIKVRDTAYERGLFVGIEYHKRFDRRSLIAKRDYAAGRFGEFVMGEAKMIEPYLYRHSNFQNWFTVDQTDPFVYVGCHYVDLVCFISGLRAAEVSVVGVKRAFPNGNEGYMWANGRVTFENGAVLSLTDGLGYPDDGAGSNEQCLTMYCEGEGKVGMIKHNDQFRGVSHSYLSGDGVAGSHFNYINPDFFRYVPWEGEGLKAVGYGVDSISATIESVSRIEGETQGYSEAEALEARRAAISRADERGLIATPRNTADDVLVTEAARLSIVNDGMPVRIEYQPNPRVVLRG